MLVTKFMRKLNARIAHFSYLFFFKWWQIVDWDVCNIMATRFRFIYLAFRFSSAENLSLSAWVS